MPDDLFSPWCRRSTSERGRHRLVILRERDGGQAVALSKLESVVPSHYDDPGRMAERAQRLGAPAVAAVLRTQLPRSKRAQSGDLGEILATEYVNRKLPFDVPVKRLRWKDGRESALRGDDLIGLRVAQNRLHLLKGEAKSRANLARSVLNEATKALRMNRGRPSAHALTFVMQRLLDADDPRGYILERYVSGQTPPTTEFAHLVFTVCGNDATSVLRTHLRRCNSPISRYYAALFVCRHGEFIRAVFDQVTRA